MYLEDSETNEATTTFKKSYKFFKNTFDYEKYKSDNKSGQIYSEEFPLVDFSNPSTNSAEWQEIFATDDCQNEATNYFQKLHLTSPKSWQIMQHGRKRGLYVVRNVFQPYGHYFLSEKCLGYVTAENRSNLGEKLVRFHENSCEIVMSLRFYWFNVFFVHDFCFFENFPRNILVLRLPILERSQIDQIYWKNFAGLLWDTIIIGIPKYF